MRIYTDHQNVLYVFAPLALPPNSPRYVLEKVHWWASHQSRISFITEHIERIKMCLRIYSKDGPEGIYEVR